MAFVRTLNARQLQANISQRLAESRIQRRNSGPECFTTNAVFSEFRNLMPFRVAFFANDRAQVPQLDAMLLILAKADKEVSSDLTLMSYSCFSSLYHTS